MIGKEKERLTLTVSKEAKKMFLELAAMDETAHKLEKKPGRYYAGHTLETLIRNEHMIRKTFGGWNKK